MDAPGKLDNITDPLSFRGIKDEVAMFQGWCRGEE